mmetsp:Transcript_36209/g.91402  ORF Transcript_36209/g.91402 Transcript_36209/m.91402 type:complete len:248 (-) Transcript_36209:1177-1920(-)
MRAPESPGLWRRSGAGCAVDAVQPHPGPTGDWQDAHCARHPQHLASRAVPEVLRLVGVLLGAGVLNRKALETNPAGLQQHRHPSRDSLRPCVPQPAGRGVDVPAWRAAAAARARLRALKRCHGRAAAAHNGRRLPCLQWLHLPSYCGESWQRRGPAEPTRSRRVARGTCQPVSLRHKHPRRADQAPGVSQGHEHPPGASPAEVSLRQPAGGGCGWAGHRAGADLRRLVQVQAGDHAAGPCDQVHADQ